MRGRERRRKKRKKGRGKEKGVKEQGKHNRFILSIRKLFVIFA